MATIAAIAIDASWAAGFSNFHRQAHFRPILRHRLDFLVFRFIINLSQICSTITAQLLRTARAMKASFSIAISRHFLELSQ